MQTYVTSFGRIKAVYDALPGRDALLICKQGFYGGCPVLKLQKASWTEDDMRSVPNQCGVFFSIWLDQKSLKKSRTHYNIHALKMRQLSGYRVTSKDFAQAFRSKFDPGPEVWPNVSTDFGPQTLMQGWIDNQLKTYEADVLELLRRFGGLAPLVDQLLAERLRRSGSKTSLRRK